MNKWYNTGKSDENIPVLLKPVGDAIHRSSFPVNDIDHTSNPPLKRCTKCGTELPSTTQYFYQKARTSKATGEVTFAFRPECRQCTLLANRTRARRPISAEQRRLYRATPEAKARNYERRHSPHYQEQKRIREQQPKYKAAHKAYLKEYQASPAGRKAKIAQNARYDAQRAQLPSDFTSDDWQHALDYFGGRCAVCGRPAGLWHTIAADHWIPVASLDCPGTVPTNIVPLCHSKKGDEGGCNNTKNDTDPAIWLARKLGPKKAKAKLKEIQAFFASVRSDGVS